MNKNIENYLSEEKGFDLLLAEEEASRCMLCYDAPCSKLCPANTNPAKFIRSVRFKNLYGAVETIRINNPLGGICARVCPTEKLCQSGCIRAGLDKPIDIGKIQRFITDFERETNYEVYEKKELTKGPIAIIGSGPSGIAAANSLVRDGYKVTIFEKNEKAGGYLTYGIPSYRLPQSLVDYEISLTLNLGVEIKYNSELGRDFTLDSLKKDGYKAIVLATGYEECNFLSMFKNNEYVETAIDFLANVKSHEGNVDLPEELLVVGGGDVAMDVAVSARKLGVKRISVVARETLDVFPSTRKSLDESISNFVTVIPGYTPVEVKDNMVSFKAVDREGVLSLKAPKIILATGQVSRLYDERLAKERNDYKVEKYLSSVKDVFCTGDIVSGDKTVVGAIKKGKECAKAIEEYLEKGEN